MGLDIVSFNVQNFTDNNGVIDDLGIDNISQIKKKAAIAKAEADKEIAVAKAQADREANDARGSSSGRSVLRCTARLRSRIMASASLPNG